VVWLTLHRLLTPQMACVSRTTASYKYLGETYGPISLDFCYCCHLWNFHSDPCQDFTSLVF
jgi:hypothetical protein